LCLLSVDCNIKNHPKDEKLLLTLFFKVFSEIRGFYLFLTVVELWLSLSLSLNASLYEFESLQK